MINMYEKLLKQVEEWIIFTTSSESESSENLGSYLDLVIKIKTIQAMDVSANLIRASRKVGKN